MLVFIFYVNKTFVSLNKWPFDLFTLYFILFYLYEPGYAFTHVF